MSKKRKRYGDKERYIRFKATGKFVVKARTKEEALRKAEEKFEVYMAEVDKDDTFTHTGLDAWLHDEMLLGLEEPVLTDEREDEIEIKWTNKPEEGKKEIYPKGRQLRLRKEK